MILILKRSFFFLGMLQLYCKFLSKSELSKLTKYDWASDLINIYLNLFI
jgi:hypothetical protein